MRPAGNLAGVEFIHPPRYHNSTEDWRLIISESGYFFTRDAIGFFSSAVSWDSLTAAGDGYLFVTSERDTYGTAWSGEKRYTLRAWTMDNGVDTLGEFGEYETLAKARAGLKKQLTNQLITTNKGVTND